MLWLGIGFGFSDCVGWFEFVWFYDGVCLRGGVVGICSLVCFELERGFYLGWFACV